MQTPDPSAKKGGRRSSLVLLATIVVCWWDGNCHNTSIVHGIVVSANRSKKQARFLIQIDVGCDCWCAPFFHLVFRKDGVLWPQHSAFSLSLYIYISIYLTFWLVPLERGRETTDADRSSGKFCEITLLCTSRISTILYYNMLYSTNWYQPQTNPC